MVSLRGFTVLFYFVCVYIHHYNIISINLMPFLNKFKAIALSSLHTLSTSSSCLGQSHLEKSEVVPKTGILEQFSDENMTKIIHTHANINQF